LVVSSYGINLNQEILDTSKKITYNVVQLKNGILTMKTIWLFLSLIFPFTTFAAEETVTYTIDIGSSYALPGTNDLSPNNQSLGIGIRYYVNENLYFMGKYTTWNSGKQDFENGKIISINIGGRTSTKFFVEGSFGIGYLDNPDGRRVKNGYLTGHRQFEVNIGGGYKINDDWNVLVGLTHFSNCQKICNLDESHKPNDGRDFIRIGVENKF